MPVVTLQPIQLSYFVPDIGSATALFNRLRWYRSRTGKDGLYEPATGGSVGPATMLGTADSPHQINGKTLTLQINGTATVDVVFSDPDPVTTAQAAAEINGATALVTATDVDGFLQIETAATGSGASIAVSGDAAPFLGLPEGAVGLDLDLTLVNGTHEYFYNDLNSSSEFWYRVEFFSTVTAETTGLGAPFPAETADHVPRSHQIICFIRLSDQEGNAIAGRRVTFHNGFLPNVVQETGGRRWMVARHASEMITDGNGYAERRMLRGLVTDIVVDGTDIVRRIQIPTTGDSVDLTNPALVVEDEFGIQEPDIDFAVRTTL